MALPIVPGSEQISTPVGAVPLDVGPLREAALAPGRLAQAIGADVGGLFQDVSQKIQDAHNTRMVFDAEKSMIQAKDQFLTDVQKNPALARDPAAWVPEYQKRVGDLQQGLLNQPGLAPVVKRELTNRLTVWGAASTAEIRTQALRKGAADDYQSGMELATYYLHNYDGQSNMVDQAISVYHSLNDKGLLGPNELKTRIKLAPGIASEACAAHVIDSAGAQAERVLDGMRAAGKLPMDEMKYKGMLRSARAVVRSTQGENRDQFAETVRTSMDHAVPEAAADALSHGEISESDMHRLQELGRAYRTEDNQSQDFNEKAQRDLAMHEAMDPPLSGDQKELDAWGAAVMGRMTGVRNGAHVNEVAREVDRVKKSVVQKGRVDENPIVSERRTEDNEDRRHHGTFIPFGRATPADRYTAGERVRPQSLEELDRLTPEQIHALYGPNITKQMLRDREELNFARYETMRQDAINGFQQQHKRYPDREELSTICQGLKRSAQWETIAHQLVSQAPSASGGYEEGRVYSYPDGRQMKKLAGDPHDPKNWEEVK